MKKTISVLIAMLLMLLMCACDANNSPDEDKVLYPEAAQSVVELGSGNKQFNFTAVDGEGTGYKFSISTDKTYVGEALEELGLLEGSEGEFGLYVNKVNGIYAQYEVTGTYWAFYVDGVYASLGIDMTEITDNATYEMKIEK
ncbi:MAG: DUF4430 domain-containing protein [Clostridia bacterium]|nr:DUF4430 domain-containing protein [Clostridia bacterium]